MKPTRILLVSFILSTGCADVRSDGNAEGEQQPASTYELQVENVPAHLRDLVPLAEKWGIGDDVERAEFIEQAPAAERQALIDAIGPHQREITAWLDSFGMDPMSDEAAAFMYMQLSVEEMPLEWIR